MDNSLESPTAWTGARIILITGTPGIGKTTVIRKIAASLDPATAGGFYTVEIREGGERRGFRWVSFDGEDAVIAHVNFSKNFRVSRYGVDVATIDKLSGQLLSPGAAVKLYLLDEIGKMECLSSVFEKAVQTILNSGKPVIATVALKGTGLIEAVKRRKDAALLVLTRANRDEIPQQVLHWLEPRMKA